MISAVRRIQFCYGHRVFNHESKCKTMHGHNGVVFVHAKALKGLDEIGRVIDFSVLKETIGKWIDLHWDHTTILYKEDTVTIDLINKMEALKPPFILDHNPTAENLAKYLLEEVSPSLLKGKGVMVFKVVFWETENCFSEVEVDENDSTLLERYR